MKIFSNFFKKEKRSSVHPSDHMPQSKLIDYIFGMGSSTESGEVVNAKTAQNITAVSACVRVLSEDISTIPLIIYRKLKQGGQERAYKHPIYKLLHRKPNNWQTSAEFRGMMLNNFLLRGNAYAEKIFANNGLVKQLIPLNPDRVYPFMGPDGKKAYQYTDLKGKTRIILPHEMHHLSDISHNGLEGLSRIEQSKEALGFSLATNKYGAKIFANGAVPGIVLKHPTKLSPEARKNLVETWEKRHQGSENANRPALLEEGLEYQQVGITPDDAQFLDSKKFSRSEVCGIFRVPPHKIGDLEKSTFSNIESQAIEYVVDAIRPIAVLWEQALVRDLLNDKEQETLYIEFLLDGLFRGDLKSRYDAYAIGRERGWLSANDIRRKENMNPIKGGDVYLAPLNMVPIEQLGISSDKEGRSLAESEHRSINETRSYEETKRTKDSFRPLFEEAAKRVVNQEVKTVKAALKKYLEKRSVSEFEKWIEEYYSSYGSTISERLMPIFATYGASIYAVAASEVGVSNTEITPDIQQFIREYVETMANRYTKSSAGQIIGILSKNKEDIAKHITKRLDEWQEKRPKKLALRETVQAAAAIQKQTYKSNGIKKLKWRSNGDDCPLCQSLNGKIVAIEKPFLEKDDEVSADGVSSIKVKSSIGHPQLHEGCNCQIVPA